MRKYTECWPARYAMENIKGRRIIESGGRVIFSQKTAGKLTW